MANRAETNTNTADASKGLRGRWNTYRSYRKTLAELQSLTDRELSDLNMARSNIGSIAFEAHYGR